MILNVSHVDKSFDGKGILTDVSFHVEEREKVALIGVNGGGKSTILKIIVGEEKPDAGQIVLAKDRTIGYLAQHQNLTGKKTVYEQLLSVRQDILDLDARLRSSERRMAVLSGNALDKEMETYARMTEAFERADGFAYRSEVTGVLKGLGFSEEDFSKQVHELSGGQKTRVALGELLLTSPDIILLDEPTNHLDLHSIEWLENYLTLYRGAVLIVSHDRYFLNRVVTKVVEIERGKARTFSGNYDAYSAKKEALRKAEYAAWVNAERTREHEEEVIRKLKSFNREKSVKRAESREKMLSRMEMPEKPREVKTEMGLHFTPQNESGKDVLSVRELAKSFDGICLFRNLSFSIRKGEHICLIGDNGTGKSTILKILNGVIQADSGAVLFGANVEVGYYDQEMQVLDSAKTIFEELSDDYPAMTHTEIRSALAAFLFTGDDVFKQIGELSGGERARVSLCKLMLSGANFLILDEPTNHLDMDSREVLESAIRAYEGTALCVSHDRYFINRTATRILDLVRGHLLNYLGNYDYYLTKKETVEAACLPEAALSGKAAKDSDAKREYLAKKEEESRVRRQKNAIARTEKEIEELESEDAAIDALFEDPHVASDAVRLTDLGTRKEEIAKLLEGAYARWEELQA